MLKTTPVFGNRKRRKTNEQLENRCMMSRERASGKGPAWKCDNNANTNYSLQLAKKGDERNREKLLIDCSGDPLVMKLSVFQQLL